MSAAAWRLAKGSLPGSLPAGPRGKESTHSSLNTYGEEERGATGCRCHLRHLLRSPPPASCAKMPGGNSRAASNRRDVASMMIERLFESSTHPYARSRACVGAHAKRPAVLGEHSMPLGWPVARFARTYEQPRR